MLKVTLVAWVPAQVIWTIVTAVHSGPSIQQPFSSAEAIAKTLIILPVFETVVMLGLFRTLKRIGVEESAWNFVAAVIWGFLHVRTQSWGLHAVWSFWVMGKCFLEVEKISVQRAIGFVAGVHVMFNSTSFVVDWMIRNLG